MSSKDIEIGRRDRITGRERNLELAWRVLRMDLPDVHDRLRQALNELTQVGRDLRQRCEAVAGRGVGGLKRAVCLAAKEPLELPAAAELQSTLARLLDHAARE